MPCAAGGVSNDQLDGSAWISLAPSLRHKGDIKRSSDETDRQKRGGTHRNPPVVAPLVRPGLLVENVERIGNSRQDGRLAVMRLVLNSERSAAAAGSPGICKGRNAISQSLPVGPTSN